MIDWIKRAWRGWFGRVVTTHRSWTTHYPASNHALSLEDVTVAASILESPAFKNALQEATVAQKNVRLASIARTRDAIKDKIADAVKAKKKRSHLQAELARLTRMELELESGK